jgi:hypothetical protein
MAIYQISEADLATETEGLFDRIYLVLQNYNFVPPDWGASIFTNSEFRGLFGGLDSKFFKPPYKEGQCVFRGRPMLGREFNYFFQGIVFSIFNFRKSSMHSIMWSWKGHYVAPEWAGGEGAWYTPSDNDYFMADAGYDASPKLWAQYSCTATPSRRGSSKCRPEPSS